jgi:hypothetical protein
MELHGNKNSNIFEKKAIVNIHKNICGFVTMSFQTRAYIFEF